MPIKSPRSLALIHIESSTSMLLQVNDRTVVQNINNDDGAAEDDIMHDWKTYHFLNCGFVLVKSQRCFNESTGKTSRNSVVVALSNHASSGWTGISNTVIVILNGEQ